MGILVFPRSVMLLCGHGDVTIVVACRSVKCGLCGVVTPIKAAEQYVHTTALAAGTIDGHLKNVSVEQNKLAKNGSV